MELQPAKEVILTNYLLKGCNVSPVHDRQILDSMQSRAVNDTPNSSSFSCYQKICTTIHNPYGNPTESVLLNVELLYQPYQQHTD